MYKEKKSPIIINLVQTEEEKAEVTKFVNEKYVKLFKTTPPKAQILLVAKRDSKIVGSVALDFCENGEMVSLGKIYDFNHSEAPFPVIPEKIVQYVRLIAIVPNLSGALLYAATVHAISQGKLYGWVEHTDKVHIAIARLGVKFLPVSGAELLIENVLEKNRIFYSTHEPMKLYMVSVPDVAKALESYTYQLIEDNCIILNIEDKYVYKSK